MHTKWDDAYRPPRARCITPGMMHLALRARCIVPGMVHQTSCPTVPAAHPQPPNPKLNKTDTAAKPNHLEKH